ncbi:MAG: lytic transglycosylase domain-containing protein [Chitinivibrionales bacterium]|nr:lytic transglycosylase domain-containing protein [Chitinivibrionales bacterium]
MKKLAEGALAVGDQIIRLLPVKKWARAVIATSVLSFLSAGMFVMVVDRHDAATGTIDGNTAIALQEIFQSIPGHEDDRSGGSNRFAARVEIVYTQSGLPWYVDDMAPALDSIFNLAAAQNRRVVVFPLEPVDIVPMLFLDVFSRFWNDSQNTFSSTNAYLMFDHLYRSGYDRRREMQRNYNRWLRDPQGPKKYSQTYGVTGYGLAQFFYLAHQARTGRDIKVILPFPSYASALDRIDSPERDSLVRYYDARLYASRDCGREIDDWLKDHSRDVILVINAVTDLADAAAYLRNNGYNPRECISQTVDEQMSFHYALTTEGKSTQRLQVVTGGTTAVYENAVTSLLGAKIPVGFTCYDTTAVETGLTSSESWIRETFRGHINELRLLEIVDAYNDLARMRRMSSGDWSAQWLLNELQRNLEVERAGWTARDFAEKLASAAEWDRRTGMILTSAQKTWREKTASQLQCLMKPIHYRDLVQETIERIDGKGLMDNSVLTRVMSRVLGDHETFSDLVLAIAQQESRSNPFLVSDAGATGMMQMMPSTQNSQLKQLEREKISPATWADAFSTELHVNVIAGTRYLAWLIARNTCAYVITQTNMALSRQPFKVILAKLDAGTVPAAILNTILAETELSSQERQKILAFSITAYNSGPHHSGLASFARLPDIKESQVYTLLVGAYMRALQGDMGGAYSGLVEATTGTTSRLANAREKAAELLRQHLHDGGAIPDSEFMNSLLRFDYEQIIPTLEDDRMIQWRELQEQAKLGSSLSTRNAGED